MHKKTTLLIDISLSNQQLTLFNAGINIFQASVATAKNGVGEKNGSECTPRGRHIIRAKIGNNCEENTVFVGRRATGEIFSEILRQQQSHRDWILTRLLWLSGLEPGINRFGNVDTMRRYIYIHGCPDSDKMGIPTSHGCVKMHNHEIIVLYDMVAVGTELLIHE